MLAFFNRIFELLRLKAGGSRNHHQIAIAVDCLFVGVEATENPLLRYIDLVGRMPRESLDAALGIFVEGVRDGDEFGVAFGVKNLCGSSRTPTPAADHSKSDLIAARCMNRPRERTGEQPPGQCGRTALDEFASIVVVRHCSSPETEWDVGSRPYFFAQRNVEQGHRPPTS